ncbi:hypothetical protein ACQ4PT_036558 [Festuca glaucescens]
MASSSARGKGKAAESKPPDLPEHGKTRVVTTAGGKTKAMKKVRMTQEEIGSYIRYKNVLIPVDIVPKVSKERLACTNLEDLGGLPVRMDQEHDYVVKIIQQINKISADFLKERDEILCENYTKGYVEREVTDDEAEQGGSKVPCTGRRRFQKGIAKQGAGSVRKLN